MPTSAGREWPDIIDAAPPHCVYLLAQLARLCADEWLEAAARLHDRLRDDLVAWSGGRMGSWGWPGTGCRASKWLSWTVGRFRAGRRFRLGRLQPPSG